MNRYAVSGTEPSLREVLDDPIVRLVMARDKVSRDDLMRMIETHRGQRAVAPGPGSAKRING